MAGQKKARTQKKRKRRIILLVIEAVILVLLGIALFFYSKLNKIQTTTLDETKVIKAEVSEETQATFEGYTTIACFGLDNRTTSKDSSDSYAEGNSDVIMVVNINNDTKEVSIVSIYRDTFLNVAAADESDKFRKANSAYAYGGAEQAVTMLNRNLDLDIDHYVSFDFYSVAEAIDILGGVDIEIESEKELSWLNEYIKATNEILGTDSDLVSGTGVQHLDGVQAVAYSRIRYTTGDDYKRTQRQRLVLTQMFENAKSASLKQLVELIDTVFPNIATDMPQSEMVSLASAVMGYDISNSSGFPYSRNTTSIGTGALGDLVVPCSLESNVIQLHRTMFGTEDYEPSETVQEYSDEIIRQTGMGEKSGYTDQFSEGDTFNGGGDTGDTSDTGDTGDADGTAEE